MKKVIFLILILGIFSSQSIAQKTETSVVCFKSNMHCENCQATLSEYLKFEKGVKDLKVDHATNTILIEYKADKNNDENLAKAVEKKGYAANKISQDEYKKIVKDAESGKKQDTK
jgi:copper chaperone CopZ